MPASDSVKPKVRKTKLVGSDLKPVESDAETKQQKKEKQEKMSVHAIKPIPQDYAQHLSKNTDNTVVDKKQKPTETMNLAAAGLLLQLKLEKLGNVRLGTSHVQITVFWMVDAQNSETQLIIID